MTELYVSSYLFILFSYKISSKNSVTVLDTIYKIFRNLKYVTYFQSMWQYWLSAIHIQCFFMLQEELIFINNYTKYTHIHSQNTYIFYIYIYIHTSIKLIYFNSFTCKIVFPTVMCNACLHIFLIIFNILN